MSLIIIVVKLDDTYFVFRLPMHRNSAINLQFMLQINLTAFWLYNYTISPRPYRLQA